MFKEDKESWLWLCRYSNSDVYNLVYRLHLASEACYSLSPLQRSFPFSNFNIEMTAECDVPHECEKTLANLATQIFHDHHADGSRVTFFFVCHVQGQVQQILGTAHHHHRNKKLKKPNKKMAGLKIHEDSSNRHSSVAMSFQHRTSIQWMKKRFSTMTLG